MRSNRTRVLAEVLSVDAWHKPFKIDEQTSAVHVELSFRNGRIGHNDHDMPFTFRIGLKRALLKVRVESPLRIDRESVARHIPSDQTQRTTITTLRENIKKDSSVNGKVDATSLAIAINAGRGKSKEITKEEQVKAVQSIPRIVVSSIPCSKSEYSWELTPGNGEILDGQPWEPVTEPRLSVKNFNPLSSLDYVISATITCSLEDIVIDELRPKNNGFVDRLVEFVTNEVSYKSAVHHLKRILREVDLEVGEISSQFSELLVADLLVIEE